MSKPEIVLSGGCLCGAVTYTSTAFTNSIGNCYCVTCRKLSGAAFLTFADFPISAITWTSGEAMLKKTRYSDLAERAHCPECGTPIYMKYDHDPQTLGITVGSIDEESVKGKLGKPDHHIFLEQKVSWFELPDDSTARHARFREQFQSKIDAWNKT